MERQEVGWREKKGWEEHLDAPSRLFPQETTDRDWKERQAEGANPGDRHWTRIGNKVLKDEYKTRG